MARRFTDRLDDRIAETGSMVCVGLDPDPSRWPARFGRRPNPRALGRFLDEVIEATRPEVAAYKAQLGAYLPFGAEGIRRLLELPRRIGAGPLTILDLKVNDIPHTVRWFQSGLLQTGGWDALTVTPWMGWESLDPFEADPGRGYFVVAHSSNPGSRDLQELRSGTAPVWHRVLAEVRRRARRSGNAGAVVGATYPEAVAVARRILGPTVPLLVPGVGAQAGDLDRTVAAGLGKSGRYLLINSSRGVLYGPGGARGIGRRAAELKRAIDAARRSARRG
ncbi:MAG: orotidine-5'-phosphate decarboxylase [Thermoplasmata archaeon]